MRAVHCGIASRQAATNWRSLAAIVRLRCGQVRPKPPPMLLGSQTPPSLLEAEPISQSALLETEREDRPADVPECRRLHQRRSPLCTCKNQARPRYLLTSLERLIARIGLAGLRATVSTPPTRLGDAAYAEAASRCVEPGNPRATAAIPESNALMRIHPRMARPAAQRIQGASSVAATGDEHPESSPAAEQRWLQRVVSRPCGASKRPLRQIRPVTEETPGRAPGRSRMARDCGKQGPGPRQRRPAP